MFELARSTGLGVRSVEFGIRLGTGEEEGVGLMNHKPSIKIQVPTIKQVLRSGPEVQQTQGVDLDVAQRLAADQPSKGHGQELVHASELLHLVIATVSGHASTESAQWQKRHELRKTGLPWFIRVLCVDTQKAKNNENEIQIDIRLKL